MLRFYMDHHVHAQISLGLRRLGIDCLTLYEDNTATLSDEQVLGRATVLERVLVSQDKDMLRITHRWLKHGIRFCGLVWSEQSWIAIGDALRDLELIAAVMTVEEMENNIIFLPL